MRMMLSKTTIFLIGSIFAEGVLSQIVTYTTKPREQIICDFSSSISSGQWGENFLNGTVELLFVLSNGNVLPMSSVNTKYENLNATWDSMNEQFALVLTDVDKDDGGTYQCVRLTDDPVDFQLDVEVVNSVVITHSGTGTVEVGKSYIFTCTAQGVRSSNQLQLVWSTDDATYESETTRTVNSDDDSLEDLESRYTLMPKRTDTFIKCGITGYQTQEEIDRTIITENVQLEVQYAPSCTLELEEVEITDSCTVELTCKCDGKPEPMTEGYQYFRDNSLIDSRNTATETLDLPLDSETTIAFTCSGSNSVGEGEQSADTPYTCASTSTLSPSSPDVKTSDDPTQCSAPALIAICCVEGAVIVAMILVFVFLYTIRKGSRKEDAQSLETHLHDATDKTSTAYMDLQETKQLSSSHVNVDVPFENLALHASFPGKSFMVYKKAQMTLTSKKEEIVVKTVSDHAPVRLANLQADEVRQLATLTSNVNVVQFLGRCNNVPNLLCFEFVNGTKLAEYVRDNFQPSKIHQYGNTKQKRYHVPEKGSVESLPRIALQITRGMKYLIAQKFLNPGLRSEKVIIDVSGQCKLYDFVSNDNAKDILAILWDKSVPYQWMPPEYLFLEKLGPSVDVWSFGVLMWEIFSYGALPHEGKARGDVEKELRGKGNLPLPKNCPGAIWQIILNCWDKSPEKRPSFDHLSLQLSHMCNDNKEYDEIQSK